MPKCKFKVGDRIINTSVFSKHEGVGGTVMQVDWLSNRLHMTSSNGGEWQLVIILDTAELLVIRRYADWVHEQDYIDGTYIPF